MSKSLPIVPSTPEQMVKEFLCHGCVCGSDTTCGEYAPAGGYGVTCRGHVIGTTFSGIGNVALGLPRGFNRPGAEYTTYRDAVPPGGLYRHRNQMIIRLWPLGSQPKWDCFNVPVWALEKGGHLFVRTVMPRTAFLVVDVVEGGTLALVPGAIDVSKFYDEMD